MKQIAPALLFLTLASPFLSSTGFADSDQWSLQYFGLFAGPSVRGLSPQQPTRQGFPDPNRPVQIRNFHTLDYLTDPNLGFGLSATALWTANPWDESRQTEVGDPYLRAYFLNLLPEGPETLPLYWYVDLRWHPGVSPYSRDTDQLFGLQLFQALTWAPRESRWMTAFYLSLRRNQFGEEGLGYDGEAFLAPAISYRVSGPLQASLMVQFPLFHRRGQTPSQWETTGLDLEPGLSWDLSPQLNFSPYLTVPVSGSAAPSRGTAFGFTLNWNWF
jgi:hypothetical protein